jgi:protein-S-isoprenylcysteine O-methyltransferase Ste14
MWDGHLGVQMGYIGWLSVWRRLPTIPWPDLPTRGVFRLCRQPIYFSFMLTLWTGPTWTMDKIYTATVWTVYCFVGPYFKERRQLSAFGARFLEYCERVPFWPGLQQKIVEVKHCEDQR